jgi:hypothetical protein
MNYNNKCFRPVSRSSNAEVTNETVFLYRQSGNVLT